MRAQSRRNLDRFVLLPLVAVAVGGAGAIAGVAGDTERITDAWYGAEIADDGSAQITEVVTWDFGPSQRHGIFRDIPGLDPQVADASAVVSSETAPDQFVVETTIIDTEPATRLRIGDPNATINQRHGYTIEYPLGSLFEAGELAWDAHGTGWPVNTEEVELHVVGATEWQDLRCFQGPAGSFRECDVSQPEPGHLVATVVGLDSFEGVTIFAEPGATLAAAPSMPEPPGAAEERGLGIVNTALLAGASALVATIPVSVWARRRGREEAPVGGAADVAFFDPDDLPSEVRTIDVADLDKLATTEFQSPRGISSVVGSIVLNEKVDSQVFTAWLLEAAIRDEIELVPDPGDNKKATLRRGDTAAPPEVEAILAKMFGGGTEVELGEYDKKVGGASTELSAELQSWMKTSGLWNPEGEHRRNRVLLFSIIGLVAGLAVGGFSAFKAATDTQPLWVVGIIVGALAIGASLAAVIRMWELKIRTPLGSALWLQVESFRRFLHHSEAQHVEAAAGYGVLRQYTAWAVALDETSAWTKAVDAATRQNPSIGTSYAGDIAFASNASSVSSWVSSTSTAPSSSGGGGGGGSGGGGGGGGGGSW